eukprot:m.186030 g.186030  ORF g.186030 m.186030 type:complete len:148 (+) comp14745_c0_seq10:118-561(+)
MSMWITRHMTRRVMRWAQLNGSTGGAGPILLQQCTWRALSSCTISISDGGGAMSNRKVIARGSSTRRLQFMSKWGHKRNACTARDSLASIVGQHNVVDATDPDRLLKYNTDWTGQFQGYSELVVLPQSTAHLDVFSKQLMSTFILMA